jgi:hypothetical protein
MLLYYSRALSMEEMSLSLAGQDAILSRGNRFYQGLFPGVTGASPPTIDSHHKYKTDRTQSETSRWSYVPHSHLRHHLKSTKKKQTLKNDGM